MTRSPTTGRPIVKLSGQDELMFNKFKHTLKSRKFQSSTPLSSQNVKSVTKTLEFLNSSQTLLTEINSADLESDLVIVEQQIMQKENISNAIEKKSAKEKTDKNINVSLEESEIVTDNETVHNNETTADDDDCICIETDSEEIISDEDDDDNELIFFKDTNRFPAVMRTPKSGTFKSRKSSPSTSLTALNNDDEIIVLDDTIDVDTITPSPVTPRNTMDESVVFVSETLPEYIPLVSDNVPKPLNVLPDIASRKESYSNSLFSKSEKKQLEAYNVNAYNPNASEQMELRRHNPKRMVIIDGSNVAYAHSRRGVFSVKGLQIAIEYFRKMGHEVKVVIPLYRTHKMKSSDPEALENLYKEGIVVLTPCKNLPGKSSSSYDDRFTLQLASELDAAIVSNDNYRDLIEENIAFKKLIENRVIGYTWCDDVFMLPKDPYGKFGPTLHSILNRQIINKNT